MTDTSVPRAHLTFLALLTAGLGVALAILIFAPEWVLGPLERLQLVEGEVLRRNRGQFYLDLVVLWGLGSSLLYLDHRARRHRRRSVWGVAFDDVGSDRAGAGSRRLALFATVFLLPALILVYGASRLADLEWLVAEDALLENATAAGFAIATIPLATAGWRLLRSARAASRLDGGLVGLLAFASLVVALEEISWGQRIFGVETPTALQGLNTQNELNLHNIATDAFEPAYLVIGGVVYAVAWLAVLARGNGVSLPPRLAAHRIVLPDPSLVFLAAALPLFGIHIVLNELVEAVATVMLLLYAFDVLRRTRVDARSSTDATTETSGSAESRPG